MKNIISRFGQSIKLPGLSFLMAFTITGIIIAVSDEKVMNKIGSPVEFLKSAGASVGNA